MRVPGRAVPLTVVVTVPGRVGVRVRVTGAVISEGCEAPVIIVKSRSSVSVGADSIV